MLEVQICYNLIYICSSWISHPCELQIDWYRFPLHQITSIKGSVLLRDLGDSVWTLMLIFVRVLAKLVNILNPPVCRHKTHWQIEMYFWCSYASTYMLRYGTVRLHSTQTSYEATNSSAARVHMHTMCRQLGRMWRAYASPKGASSLCVCQMSARATVVPHTTLWIVREDIRHRTFFVFIAPPPSPNSSLAPMTDGVRRHYQWIPGKHSQLRHNAHTYVILAILQQFTV